MERRGTMGTHFHYAWKRNTKAQDAFTTGVSLHSHTSRSRESLAFLPGAIRNAVILPTIIKWAERRYARKWREPFDYNRGYWTSPVSPEEALALEAKQIEETGRKAFVSLTDHDATDAWEELRQNGVENAPLSVEWTVPYKSAVFHIGVHNIPHVQKAVIAELNAYTKNPDPAALGDILAALDKSRDSLIVLNHPLSDQGRIGHEIHASLVNDFLKSNGRWIHALEVNALQPLEMNRRVAKLAEAHGAPLAAGGDRHGFEPNGAVNLTNAQTFAEFAHEIREKKKSDVLFMPQSQRSLTLRYAENIKAIMSDYPTLGSRASWHDRVFYECPDGVTRSFTQMISEGSVSLEATDLAIGALGVLNRVARPIAPAFVEADRDILPVR